MDYRRLEVMKMERNKHTWRLEVGTEAEKDHH